MPPVVDPWLEADQFGPPLVDFALRPEDAPDDEPMPLDPHQGLNPEVVQGTRPAGEPPPEPLPEIEDGPEVKHFEDGGSVTLEKTSKGWKATLDPGTGANPEVFWGKNKNEVLFNALEGKLKATQKIRELNLKVKLGGANAPKPAPPTQPTSRQLTTDEVFEVKTALESNPDLALENWFQKKTGLSVSQLVALAQKGAAADANLETEAISKQFLSRNPEYYPDPQGKNLTRIVQWLAKFKLGQNKADLGELYAGGVWTVENIEEAFQDLSDEGFLVKAPKPTTPVSAPAEVTPEPQPRTGERIVRTETRPRAGLGIRATDVTPAPPTEAPKPPSVEDLDAMSDAEIANTLAAIRRQKAISRRSQ